MPVISDEILEKSKPGAENENVLEVFHYLSGLSERSLYSEINDYLARHPVNPKIASTIAEALHSEGGYLENPEKWYEYMALTGLANEGQISGDACLNIAIFHYDNEDYDEAYRWASRATEAFDVPEAAFLLGSIYEVDRTRRDLVKAAACFIHTAKLIRESRLQSLSFKYFDDDDMPVNVEGQWEDMNLLGDYLLELPLDQRNALLELIKTTKPFK